MAWLTRLVPGYAPNGGHILSVLAKKTYAISPQQECREDLGSPLNFLDADLFWGAGDPARDAVREESDLVAFKPCVDVIVVGSAWAPRGKKGRFFDAGFEIGPHQRLLRVFGNRGIQPRLLGFEFTDPEPFESMPLHYGLAYGGRDELSRPGCVLTYPRNPVGRGYAMTKAAFSGLRLPNLEDLDHLLTPETLLVGKDLGWEAMPLPQTLGPMGRNCHPRLDLAGLPMDVRTAQEIERQQLLASMPEVGTGGVEPPPPSLMLNPLFYNGAPPEQRFPSLSGSEIVRLRHLDRDFPLFEFFLPGEVPTLWLDADDQGPEELSPVLQTVVIHKETNQLTLVWRGSAYYGGPLVMAQWSALRFGVEGG